MSLIKALSFKLLLNFSYYKKKQVFTSKQLLILSKKTNSYFELSFLYKENHVFDYNVKFQIIIKLFIL